MGEENEEEEEGQPMALADAVGASVAALLGLAATLTVSFAAGCLFGGRTPLREAPGDSASRSASPVSFSVPDIGEKGVLTRQGSGRSGGAIPVARSAAAYDAMVAAAAHASPNGGKRSPVAPGQVEPVAPGTPAVFVRYDWGSYQVRLAGGPHKGERVWVSDQFWEKR